MDGRLQVGDEITHINGRNVMDATHREVIELMGEAAALGEVRLGVRRKVPPADVGYPANTLTSGGHPDNHFQGGLLTEQPPFRSVDKQEFSLARIEREVVVERVSKDQSFGFVLQSNLHRRGCTISKYLTST